MWGAGVGGTCTELGLADRGLSVRKRALKVREGCEAWVGERGGALC